MNMKSHNGSPSTATFVLQFLFETDLVSMTEKVRKQLEQV